MAEGEKKFRAKIGWIEKPMRGKPYWSFQHGSLNTFRDAMQEARSVKGWVEEDGKIAHITDTKHPINLSSIFQGLFPPWTNKDRIGKLKR